MSTKANKPVLCEKPIDLDINKVNECRDKIAGSKNLIQIGLIDDLIRVMLVLNKLMLMVKLVN